MAKNYKLVIKELTNVGTAKVVYAAHGSTPFDYITQDGILLARMTHPGAHRPHANPPGRVTLTIAALIELPPSTRVIVEARRKHEDTGIEVLVAETSSSGVLKVSTRENSVTKTADDRKSQRSKLRRNTRSGPITFWVWTRDQQRYTIRNA